MNYLDKQGNPIIEGSILFYSEPIPYAESIHLVEIIDGKLHGRSVIGNYSGKYNLVENDKPVNLRFYCSFPDNDYRACDATVIGHKDTNPEMLTVEYAEKNHPLNQ